MLSRPTIHYEISRTDSFRDEIYSDLKYQEQIQGLNLFRLTLLISDTCVFRCTHPPFFWVSVWFCRREFRFPIISRDSEIAPTKFIQTTFNLNVTYSNIGYKKSQPIYIFRYHVKLTLPNILGLQKNVNPNCAQCFLNGALCFV